jgi:hypothetical protein
MQSSTLSAEHPLYRLVPATASNLVQNVHGRGRRGRRGRLWTQWTPQRRPVTEAEFSQALDHLKPGPQPDFAAAYEEAFPQDRTRDDGQRQDLMAEFMEDDTAQKDAEEAGAIEKAGE